jgi:excisionase family DNA binding protein
MEKVTMTTKEAANFLGVSKDLLYKEVRCGKIPHTRLGTTILFRRDTLLSWIEQQENKSVSC